MRRQFFVQDHHEFKAGHYQGLGQSSLCVAILGSHEKYRVHPACSGYSFVWFKSFFTSRGLDDIDTYYHPLRPCYVLRVRRWRWRYNRYVCLLILNLCTSHNIVLWDFLPWSILDRTVQRMSILYPTITNYAKLYWSTNLHWFKPSSTLLDSSLISLFKLMELPCIASSSIFIWGPSLCNESRISWSIFRFHYWFGIHPMQHHAPRFSTFDASLCDGSRAICASAVVAINHMLWEHPGRPKEEATRSTESKGYDVLARKGASPIVKNFIRVKTFICIRIVEARFCRIHCFH